MSISTSDLDFEKIKTKLKTYFKQSDEFGDYDFEASGLSNILDVLAYNTHVNGLTANMAINESFLSTAQLRSSVLQHAEALGYYPKSATAATAYLNVSVTIPGGPGSMVLPEYTEFSADVDEVSYIFRTMNNVSAPNVNDTYTFDVEVKQGEPKVRTFVVGSEDDDQVFVIPDENMDTSTVVVKVFDNFTTVNYTPYVNVNDALTINEDSTVYMLREAANGQYELFFGDGNVLGKAPVAGNKIRVEYLSTQGSIANTASEFVGSILSVGGSEYQIVVNSVVEASGGSEKESIASIKRNAPALHATQKRLVTAQDYQSLIGSTFSQYLNDVIAWGGQDNVPPKFGAVFVSLNFKEGLSEEAKTEVQRLIKDQLTSNISIMSIDTEFVDPEYTQLELNVSFNVDPAKTSSTVQALEVQVKQLVESYFENNLNTFNTTFRRSNLLSQIDDLSTAILNSRIDVKVQQSVPDVLVGFEKDYNVNFPIVLATPDKDEHIITTSSFVYKGQRVFIKNELGSNRLQIFNLSNEPILFNVGEYDPNRGRVTINALNIEESTNLKISAKPANQSTIKPLRNYIVTLDSGMLNVSSVKESGMNKVVL
jgi:hypothetical protein